MRHLLLALIGTTLATMPVAAQTTTSNPVPDKQTEHSNIYGPVELKPTFPGGDTALYLWIARNIVYPPSAAEEKITGKVTLQFIVEKDGSLSNIKVVRGVHPALDAEAIRVVKKMPRWSPGKMEGRIVRATYILPITFKL